MYKPLKVPDNIPKLVFYWEKRCLYKQVGNNRKEANNGSGIQKSSTDSIFWLKKS